MQLQNYNNRMYDFIADEGELDTDSLHHYVTTHMIPDLRVTLITPQGKVVYDNIQPDTNRFENHRTRKEVQDALMYGSGYDISRHSASIKGEAYFYSARYYPSPQLIIRSPLPYHV